MTRAAPCPARQALARAERKRLCECGGTMRMVRRDYPFPESGLSNVMLENIEVMECSKCGTSNPRIPRFNDLMRTLAVALISKPSGLTGEEVKYLRGFLGETSQDFAEMLSIDKSHMSRIENGALPIGAKTDRLVRFNALLFGDGLREKVDEMTVHFEHPLEKGRGPFVMKVQPATGKFTYQHAA